MTAVMPMKRSRPPSNDLDCVLLGGNLHERNRRAIPIMYERRREFAYAALCCYGRYASMRLLPYW
jgi:hypothetical protein